MSEPQTPQYAVEMPAEGEPINYVHLADAGAVRGAIIAGLDAAPQTHLEHHLQHTLWELGWALAPEDSAHEISSEDVADWLVEVLDIPEGADEVEPDEDDDAPQAPEVDTTVIVAGGGQVLGIVYAQDAVATDDDGDDFLAGATCNPQAPEDCEACQ